MKRRELAVGLEVEVQKGREHRSYERAVVLAVEPWTKQETWRSTVFRPVQYDHDPKTGVAVAVERSYFRKEPPSWQPDVVPLSKLVPAGSEAAYEAEQAAGREARKARKDAVAEHQRNLNARTEALVGATGVWLRGGGGVVEVSAETYERLLDLAEHGIEVES